MDILRTIAHQPISNNKMCEHTHSKPTETRRGKLEDSVHATQEMSRIISDCTTGKCYCRGKVLGKVCTPFNIDKRGLEKLGVCGGGSAILDMWWLQSTCLCVKAQFLLLSGICHRFWHFWCWKFTSKPECWLSMFVFTGWICQMLWIYRSGYRQSVCCENYSTHARLQTSPKGKGVLFIYLFILSHTVTRLLADSHSQRAKLLLSCFTDWQRNWTAQSPSPQTHCPILLPLWGQRQYLHPSRALQQTSKCQHNSPIQAV